MADAAAPPKKSPNKQGRSDQKTPRYMQVAMQLRDAILADRYADGQPFPTETALCREYDVSRFTVREALKRLQNEGLISRKRGSGTTVQPAAARGGALHQPLSNVGEILQYAQGSEVVYEERDKGVLQAEVAEHIGEDTKGIWRRFRGVRRQSPDNPPLAVTDAYFHEKLGDAVDKLDLGAGTLFSQIERIAGITIGRVTQDIQAVSADARIAGFLEIDEGKPVLQIVRCYLDPAGKVYEISVSHHPGDRFAYAMHIDLDS